jgi:hypothetical protein
MESKELSQVQQPGYNQVGVFQESEALMSFRLAMQNFTGRLNAAPSQESTDKTADGRGKTILISHIETLMDEYFFGLWSTSNFHWQQIANEIVGSITVTVIHPVWGKEITREGAASITIMMDKAPDGLSQRDKKPLGAGYAK